MRNKILSVACGILFGLGALVIKLSFVNTSLLLLSVGLAIGGLGFLIMQYALKDYFADTVAIIINSVSTLLTVFVGVAYLSETLTIFKLIGVIILMLGIVTIGVES